MKKIVYTNSTGVLCIVSANPKLQKPGELEDFFLARIAEKDVEKIRQPGESPEAFMARIKLDPLAPCMPWRLMEENAIPSDRTFREAWEDTTLEPVVDVNMDKARDIHLNRIREARNEALAENDIEIRKAWNDPEKQTELNEHAQVLRDLPATIDLSMLSTPDELKEYWPGMLSTEKQ